MQDINKAIKSETVEISKEAMSLNSSIIFKILMGRTSCSEEDGEAERTRGLVIEFDEFLEKILRKHEEEKISEHQSRDMMDVLLEASRDENADYKITRNHIKYFLIIRQTTQWTMAEIMNDTNILERLKEEIDCVVGKSRLIQETDLPNLPYLQGVVKEGLRLRAVQYGKTESYRTEPNRNR
ncbi:BnaC07g03780D [Brassica napus]|uniref:BnaC07g03780D protein n=1 Tax=Brassica napus TaxID=3708 RepID=A0A078GIN5_BRANA|nr:BnaC07g03780D [Brassica napus]